MNKKKKPTKPKLGQKTANRIFDAFRDTLPYTKSPIDPTIKELSYFLDQRSKNHDGFKKERDFIKLALVTALGKERGLGTHTRIIRRIKLDVALKSGAFNELYSAAELFVKSTKEGLRGSQINTQKVSTLPYKEAEETLTKKIEINAIAIKSSERALNLLRIFLHLSHHVEDVSKITKKRIQARIYAKQTHLMKETLLKNREKIKQVREIIRNSHATEKEHKKPKSRKHEMAEGISEANHFLSRAETNAKEAYTSKDHIGVLGRDPKEHITKALNSFASAIEDLRSAVAQLAPVYRKLYIYEVIKKGELLQVMKRIMIKLTEYVRDQGDVLELLEKLFPSGVKRVSSERNADIILKDFATAARKKSSNHGRRFQQAIIITESATGIPTKNKQIHMLNQKGIFPNSYENETLRHYILYFNGDPKRGVDLQRETIENELWMAQHFSSDIEKLIDMRDLLLIVRKERREFGARASDLKIRIRTINNLIKNYITLTEKLLKNSRIMLDNSKSLDDPLRQFLKDMVKYSLTDPESDHKIYRKQLQEEIKTQGTGKIEERYKKINKEIEDNKKTIAESLNNNKQ